MQDIQFSDESGDPEDPMFKVTIALRVLAALVDRAGGEIHVKREELADMEGAFYVEIADGGIKIKTQHFPPDGTKLQ